MPLIDIHLPAVVTAAVVASLLRALWFSRWVCGPLRGRLRGYDPVTVERLRRSAGPGYAVAALCDLVSAIALSALLSWSGVAALHEGLAVAFVVWLGFVATSGLVGHGFADRDNPAAYLLDTLQQLAGLLLQGGVLAAWHGGG
jgi:hypothetical protein